MFKTVLEARTEALNKLRQKRHRGDLPIKNREDLGNLGDQPSSLSWRQPQWKECSADVPRIRQNCFAVPRVASQSG
jgi:hypothetical protein